MSLGRNEQCLCGSGKKYKKCCIALDEQQHRCADTMAPQKGGEPTLLPQSSPYASLKDNMADIELMTPAWEEHYGLISDDFSPPLFVEDGEGLIAAPWVETYRNLLLEKYKSMDLVEPRIEFILRLMGQNQI